MVYKKTLVGTLMSLCLLSGLRSQSLPKACPIYIAHELHPGTLTAYSGQEENLNCPGGTVIWENLSRSRQSDDQYTEIVLSDRNRSQCLWLKDLNLNIPPGATIQGLRVDLEGHQTGSSLLTTRVQLTDDNGQRIGMNQSAYVRGEDWPQGNPGFDDFWWYGGDKDTWDANLTSDMMNDPDFGMVLQIRKPLGGDTSVARLDQVKITVFFSPLFTICHDSCTVFYVDEVPGANSYHWKLPPDALFFNKDTNNNVVNLDVRNMDFGVHQLCVETESTLGRSTPCCMNFRLAECLPGSVGDFVWDDQNQNGRQDTGEPGLEGLQMALFNAFSFELEGMTVTDSTGHYQFDDVPEGHYYIEILAPQAFQPSPFLAASSDLDSDLTGDHGPNTTRSFFVGSDEDKKDIDLGFIVSCGAIAPTLQWSASRSCYDGQAMRLEFGNLTGAVIPPGFRLTYFLLDDNNVIVEQSDINEFSIMSAGTYGVVAFVYNDDPTHPDYINLSTFVNTGRSIEALEDFIELIQVCADLSDDILTRTIEDCASISGNIWHDINQNGLQDPNETYLEDQQVILYDAPGNEIDRDTTDSNGAYSFTSLADGDYRVQFVPDTVYRFTQSNVGADDQIDSDCDLNGDVLFALQPGQDGEFDGGVFRSCNLAMGTLDSITASVVCWDQDTFNISASEVGLPQIPFGFGQFFLISKNGWIEAFSTEPQFQVDTTAIFCIHEILIDTLGSSPDFLDIHELSNGTFTPDDIFDLLFDEDICALLDLNGLCIDVPKCASATNLIGDYVWRDNNSNGLQDAGEPGVNDMKVKLYSSAGQLVDETTTQTGPFNQGGYYEFTGVPSGSYYVKFDLPLEYFFAQPNAGTNDALDSDVTESNGTGTTDVFSIGALDTISTIDAGVMKAGSIGDFVWLDENSNGLQDADEPGVNGLKVFLYDAFGFQIDSTTTQTGPMSQDGYYLFDGLAPGPYFVRFDTLIGQVFTNALQGFDAEIDSDVNNANGLGTTEIFNLSPGEALHEIDAGFVDPQSILSKIGDYVWLDRDNDGIQDGFENGVNGVTVHLYNAHRELIQTTVTDYHPHQFLPGYYEFDSLVAREYFLVFEPPLNHEFALSFAGFDNERDSDISNVMMYGSTNILPLYAGESKMSIDAGFIRIGSLGDQVWEDLNANGIQEDGEPGINDVTVFLYNQQDEMVDSVLTTDGPTGDAGFYVFNDIPPGGYYLKFDLPNQYIYSPANEGGDDTRDSDVNESNGEGTTAIINISPGEHDRDADCGMYRAGMIGYRVWLDSDYNGLQDVDEEGIPNIDVAIYNMEDSVVARTTTDFRGEYSFENLPMNDYYLMFTVSNDYMFTAAHMGIPTMDSDVTHAYGYGSTGTVHVAPGTMCLDLDAGLSPQIVLAVDMIDLELMQTDDQVKLLWSVEDEQNIKEYIVERRAPSTADFQTMTTVTVDHAQALGNHVNTYSDFLTDEGEYLYRIQAKQWSGESVTSTIVSAQLEPSNEALSIYPVPFSDLLMLDVEDETTIYRVEITDIQSRKIYFERQKPDGMTQLDTQEWPSGVYIIRWETDKGVVFRKLSKL